MIQQEYVQYHHTERFFSSCNEVMAGEFLVGTNKRVKNLLGRRLWVICGEGRPRQYWLCKSYTVDEIRQVDDPDFRLHLWGSDGMRFQPPFLLNPLPWFSLFCRSQSNFSFGLNRIAPVFVSELHDLVNLKHGSN
ncbi:MAG TPA: hypothetical protein PKE45_05360 [Caldilineaceae bacterium]|nr:hypothetical protein [Caldilineaceae bacterium]